MWKKYAVLWKRGGRRGAALVEFGILVGLVAVLAIFAVTSLGTRVQLVFTDVSSEVDANVEAARVLAQGGGSAVIPTPDPDPIVLNSSPFMLNVLGFDAVLRAPGSFEDNMDTATQYCVAVLGPSYQAVEYAVGNFNSPYSHAAHRTAGAWVVVPFGPGNLEGITQISCDT